MSCLKFRKRADTLRSTWVTDIGDRAEVFFFLGNTHSFDLRNDEVSLNVPDDYPHLRHKVQAMCHWAVKEGYELILKCDDDVYLIADRLFTLKYYDYSGRMRHPSREQGGPEIYGPKESFYCSGFAYWLSRRSAAIVASAPDNGDWAEDRFVGNALAKYGIFPVHDTRFQLWPSSYGERHVCTRPNPNCEACRQVFGSAIVLCPHEKQEAILHLHRWWHETGFIPTGDVS